MARKKNLHPILVSLLSSGLALYIRAIERTLRWEYIGNEHHQALITSGKPFICAFWHSRLLMMPMLQRAQNSPFAVLVSEHGDGELIAQTVAKFGIDTRRGSAANPRKKEKNKGGASALKSLIAATKAGMNTGLTPDGPRGPRQQAQMGVIQLARLTGAPVIPVAYSVRRAVETNSWDRFLLPIPLPFSKGVAAFGPPLWVPSRGPDARGPDAMEQHRRQLEDQLNQITALADERAGRAPSSPMAVSSPPNEAEAS